MTDSYLQSLGFVTTTPGQRPSYSAFGRAWRYQHDHNAQDGTSLFLEHPLGIDCCRLSALAAPLAAEDVFASVALHDQPALAAAVQAFYAAHGGIGPERARQRANRFLPYRRLE
ncbi:hypothetical protein [Hymenobacter metallicola]|uniref:Uncharacterized protein n=1 Tax=Hymenobacter metallicola TaxID=2563114 RepID=A0A4Z0QH17_9BACT|nr:hypothetical protein [Hymenobacter metallicola]TGE29320.1 hypothetical protein E5K02_07660 [Hymenobacter metallicola]